MITCPRCAGDGYLDYTCKSCNGSGEGLADGTRCGVCPRSEGVIRDTCDVCKGECKVLAPSFMIKDSYHKKGYFEIEEVGENKLIFSYIYESKEVGEQIAISIDDFLKLAEKIKNMREE